MKTFLNDYNPNSDCTCVLSIELNFVKNDNLVGAVGHMEVDKVIRYPNKICREHHYNSGD